MYREGAGGGGGREESDRDPSQRNKKRESGGEQIQFVVVQNIAMVLTVMPI